MWSWQFGYFSVANWNSTSAALWSMAHRPGMLVAPTRHIGAGSCVLQTLVYTIPNESKLAGKYARYKTNVITAKHPCNASGTLFGSMWLLKWKKKQISLSKRQSFLVSLVTNFQGLVFFGGRGGLRHFASTEFLLWLHQTNRVDEVCSIIFSPHCICWLDQIELLIHSEDEIGLHSLMVECTVLLLCN